MDVRIALVSLLAPGLMFAQLPSVGIIDFYGLRKVPETRVRKVLGISEGDRLPGSKGSLEEKLEQIPGVVRANVEAVCCDEGRTILYVGIEEKGAPHFGYRLPPNADVSLPPAISGAFHDFLAALERAVRSGNAAEDLTRGYSLMLDPECRAYQEQFRAFAEQNVQLLDNVLRNSRHDQERATAAYVIGYAPKKRGVVGDLLYAMQDPDDSVRNNAMRSLSAIAVLASRDSDPGLRIPATWFIEMLNSIIWSDRNKAALALVNLTEKPNPTVLQQLRDRALPALVEMAQWKALGHALPAYILLGRAGGLSEAQIQNSWQSGERQKTILQIVKNLGGKK